MGVNELNTIPKIIKTLTPQFPYVFAWGKTLAHTKYEIAEQLKEAYNDKASKCAVYKKYNGLWMSAKALKPASLKTLNEELPARLHLKER